MAASNVIHGESFMTNFNSLSHSVDKTVTPKMIKSVRQSLGSENSFPMASNFVSKVPRRLL
jgi:hypothetical protein